MDPAGVSALATSVDSVNAQRGLVVHLVGRMTDAVFNFLGPTTAALAAGGCRQLVLTYDDPTYAEWLQRIDLSVDISLVPQSRNPVARWSRLERQFSAVVSRELPAAVHLHGLMPSVVGSRFVSRLVRGGTKVYMSPHSSKSLRSLRWLGRPIFWLLSATVARQAHMTIANVPFDVRALNSMSDQVVSLIESPVADAFFSLGNGQRARSPLVVGSGMAEDGHSAAGFAQLAVLLGGEDLGLAFNWIGSADHAARAQLDAAHIGVFNEFEDARRASRLASAWVYVMAGPARGFPLPLAEAMAIGLPCVALDDASHRDMIRHGETGLLCADPPAMMQAVAQLIESPELRQKLGSAARAEAAKRFRNDDFERRVFEAYAQV